MIATIKRQNSTLADRNLRSSTQSAHNMDTPVPGTTIAHALPHKHNNNNNSNSKANVEVAHAKTAEPSTAAAADGARIKQSPAVDTVHTRDATRYLFKSFRILGVYMPHQHKRLYALYSLVLNGLVTIWLPLSFAISYATMSDEDVQIGNLLTSIQVGINLLGCSVKIIIMAFLQRQLRSAEELLSAMDARCRAEDELAEKRKVVRQGNRCVVFFAASYWSYSSSTFLSSLAMGRPPYAVYNPFVDWRKSQLEFVLAACIEYVLMDVACFQQVATDSYAVIYVCILRAHMKILLLRVQKLGSSAAMTLEENFEELKMCIKDHKNLLKLYSIIAPIISITIFIQFMITAAMLGTTLINIMLFAVDISSRVASCFYIVAVVVEIFPLCYQAQCLIDDSNRLANVIFHSNWMGQNADYRKMLVVFMQHTQRPMELMAGKLFPITLNSFLSIAKFSFTLYSFINEMGIKERFELK